MDLRINILEKNCLEDSCVNGIEGEIQIGDYKETLYIPLDWWDVAKYQRQWKEGVIRLSTHDTSCLIVAVNNPNVYCYIEWWLLYKTCDKIYIQNHILTEEIYQNRISKNFNLQSCYDFIPERGGFRDKYGNKVSEWVVGWDGK